MNKIKKCILRATVVAVIIGTYIIPASAIETSLPSPFAYFSFDNINGLGLDTSGNGNDLLTYGNPRSEASGKIGSSCYFDGASSLYAEPDKTTHLDFLDVQSDFTITFWYKSTDALMGPAGRANRIVDNGYNGAFAGGFSINLMCNSGWTGTIIGTSTADGYYWGDSGAPWYANTGWCHVALTATKSGSTKLYINGVLQTEKNYSKELITSCNKALFSLGAQTIDDGLLRVVTGDSYKGYIDEVGIYNCVLTTAQISALFTTEYTCNFAASLPQSNSDALTPVAYLGFDNADLGSDKSGNENNFNIYGSPVLVDGKVGNGVYFDGASSIYASKDGTGKDFADKMTSTTVSMWVKVNPSDLIIRGICSSNRLIDNGENGAFTGGYTLSMLSDGTNIGPIVGISDTVGGHHWGAGNSNWYVQSGEWTHLAFEIDGSNNKAAFYVNGLLLSQTNLNFTPNLNCEEALFAIGAQILDDGNGLRIVSDSFKGYVDEIKIFDKALTADEIQSLTIEYGDLNNDDKTDVADLIIVKNHILGKHTEQNILIGDIDKDRKVTIVDLLLLKNTVIGELDNKYSEKDTPGSVYVDFSKADFSKTPYLKKFDLFNCTWSWLDTSAQNTRLNSQALSAIPSLAKLGAESMRSDLFMGYGGIGGKIGSSTSLNGTSSTEYLMTNTLSSILNQNQMRPYFCYFANPVYTGGGGINDLWKTVPNLTKWKELCHNIAGYYKNNNFNVMTHEIWNEPDFDNVFFTGTWQDYINVYINGAEGIREADSDAVIGGVSAAWIQKLWADGRYTNFLNQIKSNGTPLDFVSWHYYGKQGTIDGNPNSNDDLDTYINAGRSGISSDDYFSTVQQHLNEFNITAAGSSYSSFEMVEGIFNVYQRLLSSTDVTRVSWAMPFEYNTITPALSLIDPYTFERYPSFRAMWMYSRLPVKRVSSENCEIGVKTMAASDSERSSLIAYDTSNESHEVTFLLDNVKSPIANVSIYGIGGIYNTTSILSDEPALIESYNNIETSGLKYTVTVPANGAIYIEVNSGTAVLEKDSTYYDNAVKKDYWYPQRSDNGAFAEVDLDSMSACVGSGNSDENLGTGCFVTMKGMNGQILDFNYETVGSPIKRSERSMLGITVDYETVSGYTKKIYFYVNNINGKTNIPLGKDGIFDSAMSLDDLNGLINLNLYAPEGWTGKLLLGYVINNVGSGNGCMFHL